MKTCHFFLTAMTLMLMISCAEKKVIVTAEEQSIYLTPEIMCGTVEFTDGCGPSTDTLIRFGIALLHHMTYDDAAYTFDKVIEKDPDCFWGHWGKAMTYIHPMWPDMPSEEQMESGYILSQRALSLAKKPNEKLYGAAVAAYYAKSDKKKGERLVDFQKAWGEAHAQLPDDPEAELFNGLMRLAVVPPSDKSFTIQKEVGATAENLLIKYPNHPGAYHYAIHAYDVPPLASKALVVARDYGKIAPEIPHALHMPSHIFTRLGLWQESIDWNSRSAVAAQRLPVNGQVNAQLFHALDYMAYAYLQYGQDEKVARILARIDSLRDKPFFASPVTAYAIAAIPSRIPMENHQWADAAKIPVPDTSKVKWQKYPQYEALVHFARGIGGARSGNMEVANDAATRLETIYTNFGEAPENKYWREQVNIQRIAVNAWIAYAKGEKEKALALMNESADLEEATQKNPVSPGELLPARELLGDMLFEMKKHAEAIAAYQKSLESRPNRFNSLFGAGKAAEAAGDNAKAKEFYSQLVALKGDTPSKRERAEYAQMQSSKMN